MMTGPDEPFQSRIEAAESYSSGREIPTPFDPLQAQTAFERRAAREDLVAHIIAVIQTTGFFALAFAGLLGFVDLNKSAVATFLGTIMGYAVAKVDPILTRYFISRSRALVPHERQQGPPSS